MKKIIILFFVILFSILFYSSNVIAATPTGNKFNPGDSTDCPISTTFVQINGYNYCQSNNQIGCDNLFVVNNSTYSSGSNLINCKAISASLSTYQSVCDSLYGANNSIVDTTGYCKPKSQVSCDRLFVASNTSYNSQSGICNAITQVGCDNIFGSGTRKFDGKDCQPINQMGCDSLYGANNTTYNSNGKNGAGLCNANNQTGCDNIFGINNKTWNGISCVNASQNQCDISYGTSNTKFDGKDCQPSNQKVCDNFYGQGNTNFLSSGFNGAGLCQAINQTGCDKIFGVGTSQYTNGTCNAVTNSFCLNFYKGGATFNGTKCVITSQIGCNALDPENNLLYSNNTCLATNQRSCDFLNGVGKSKYTSNNNCVLGASSSLPNTGIIDEIIGPILVGITFILLSLYYLSKQNTKTVL